MEKNPKFGPETRFSPEQELEYLLKAYRDSHFKIFIDIDGKQSAENEKIKQITELSLYNFNVGLLMGMMWKK